MSDPRIIEWLEHLAMGNLTYRPEPTAAHGGVGYSIANLLEAIQMRWVAEREQTTVETASNIVSSSAAFERELRAEEELRKANKRMRAELEAAAEIQKSLLPSRAQVLEKVRVAWAVQPCEELDGDTLNIFRLDREHLGLYVLDVSGHGASAAMLSVALHRVLAPVPGPTSLLTRLQDGGSKYDIVSPAVVCRELNSLFPMDADAVVPQYFTLIYGVLNTKTRQFRYALAGHPPPIYEPPQGQACEIGRYGFPVGLFSNASYEDQLVKAEPGARLYFYSDGLTDVVNLHNEAFGRDRLRQAVDEGRDRPLEDALSYLLERVQAWSSNSRREDDVSLLAVEIQ